MEYPTLTPGSLVAGKLRVVRTLGQGGMGTVYEVEHELTKHRRALKVLHAFAVEQPSVVERFLREASAAGRVGNSHVAETFDAGKLEDGEPYLLMELLAGETLEGKLQREGPIDPGELADLVCQACDGIQAAHDAGIVHRDLKPENLMIVAKDGAPFVKIFDFGISKFDAERTGSLKLTQEGLVMGTPYYMSPEQVRGAASIDARTDIYAIGVILYECISGVRPFEAQAIQHLAVLIHEGKPTPVADRRPGLAPGYAAVIHRAMAADRDQRFESAKALAAALAPFRNRASRVGFAQSSYPPAPSRVVVTPSGATSQVASMAGPMSGPSTGAALAKTMGTEVPGVGRTSRVLGASAAVLVAGAALGAFAFMRSPHPDTAPPAAPVVTNAPEPEKPAAAAVAPPPPAAADLPPLVTTASAPKTEPAHKPSPVGVTPAPSASVHAPAASASGATPAPSAKPKDDTGLARDNPFR